jgi:hypothetical protein
MEVSALQYTREFKEVIFILFPTHCILVRFDPSNTSSPPPPGLYARFNGKTNIKITDVGNLLYSTVLFY